MPRRLFSRIHAGAVMALLIAVLLSSCASVPDGGRLPSARGDVAAAQAAEAEQNWPQAAAEWLALAGQGLDSTAQSFRVRALSALLHAQDPLRARVVFSSLDQGLLSSQEQEQLTVLQADLLLQEGRPAEALVALPLQLALNTDANWQQRFLRVRANSFAQQGALVSAIEDFTALDRLLAASNGSALAEGAQNWQLALWPVLVATDEATLKQGIRRSRQSVVAGWLELGLIGREEWLRPALFEQRLDAWQSRYRLHVANAVLVPALREAHARRQQYPQHVVVMLPLSGRFAAVGNAVRDGLLAAWYQTANRPGLQLHLVDTEAPPPDWREPLADATSVAIVGPLRKEKIAELAQSNLPETWSWLPLNQLDATEGEQAPVALALSPEQEARLAAQRMGLEGYRKALVLVAEGDWGQRVSEAFRQQFEASGGSVVGVERYDMAKANYGDTVERVLLLKQSERRRTRMSRLLGRQVEFEPRRRQDADAVFAPGKATALRALRPQLRYHHASGLAVFSSSHVWDGKANPSADLDLNGVRFADMPWRLQPSQLDERLQKSLSQAGANARLGSFHALGADALRLLPFLADSDSAFPWFYPGGTGFLSLGDGDMIQRQLIWAEFKKGKPRLAPAPKLPLDS